MQHLNEAWEQHRAFLAAIYEYQVFLKEEKMVDGTSSAHEVRTYISGRGMVGREGVKA